MNKFLLIFALLIAACDEKEPIPCKSVAIQISDANPIQFWPVDCQTYNELEVCGVHHKCWCHPWNCDDEIKIQFTDTEVLPYNIGYFLRIYDNDENLIDLIQFDSYASGSTFVYSLTIIPSEVSSDICNNQARFEITKLTTSGGQSIAAEGSYDVAWSNDASEGQAPWVITSSDFYVLFNAFGFEGPDSQIAKRMQIGGGESVTITQYLEISSTAGIRTYNLEYNFYLAGVFVGTLSKTYTVQSGVPYFGEDQITGAMGTFDEIRITVNHPELSFSHFDIIDLVLDSVYNDEIQAKSDCLDIADAHDCTTIIDYSNNRNFAGLIYDNVSPEQTFNIRVPAIFFHEQFPEEDEAMELTTGIQKTSGTLKAQRLFETDYMPYYMHRKLMLIFKHQTINIESLAWIKEEKYEIQPGDRRWPVKKAKCLLNENYIQRAVL